jgi:NAD(P)-dependent dehydrogenase (short-subunit alcohol dehydrogenase family)
VGVFDLTGRVALVTGAGQGVGAGIAASLATAGALVAVNDVEPSRAEATTEAVRRASGTAVAVAFDVTDEQAVHDGVGRAGAALGGPVEILVNNAGVPAGMALAPFAEMPSASWARYVDLNLYGSMHCVAAVLDAMRSAGRGRIIQISSAAGRTGIGLGVSLYGASKSGIEGFVRHLSQEVARDGVTVNTLALGLMDPGGGGTSDATAPMARGIPVGRLGLPADVGAATVFLASEEAAWITGQTINLNGGATTS